jgi:hypothetical protein
VQDEDVRMMALRKEYVTMMYQDWPAGVSRKNEYLNEMAFAARVAVVFLNAPESINRTVG